MNNDAISEEDLEDARYRYGWLRNEFLRSAQIIGKQQDEIDSLKEELREVERTRDMVLQEYTATNRQNRQGVKVDRKELQQVYDMTFIKGGPHLLSIEVFLERLGFDITGVYK